jgi:hypothetical protein
MGEATEEVRVDKVTSFDAVLTDQIEMNVTKLYKT